MRDRLRRSVINVTLVLFAASPSYLSAGTSEAAKRALVEVLMGQEVKALIQLPASKEGIDVYYTPPSGKRLDARGMDLHDMTKWLKEKGVGIEVDSWEIISNVRITGDKVEVHLGGGGQGRRGSKHAAKVSPTFKRAGGSRINFRYGVEPADANLRPEIFLQFMERVLDVSRIRFELSKKDLPAEIKSAIDAKTVKEGMTYEMVLMSFGEPEQKKVSDNPGGDFSETWYYLKAGHRWILDFTNGKVAKVRVF